MSDYHIKRAKEILNTVIYATVATASESGKPWNSPVAFFADDQLNLYWFSDKESVHSKNIRQNQDIFIVIYDSTMKESTGEGVFIEAMAYEVGDMDEVRLVASFQRSAMAVSPEKCIGEAVHRFYKAVPKNVWMNDDEKDADGHYVKDIRVSVPFSALMAK